MSTRHPASTSTLAAMAPPKPLPTTMASKFMTPNLVAPGRFGSRAGGAGVTRSSGLTVDRLHASGRVPLPRRHPLGRHLVDLLQVGRSDLDFQAGQVLVQVLPPLGGEEGHDVLS